MTISPPVLEQVRLRAQFACEYCGVMEADTGGELTVDHFQPSTRGGSDDASNLLYCGLGYCRLSRSAYMDPVSRVRDFLLDNVGHMTYPGNPSFDARAQRWLVPICCRTGGGSLVVGDVELDREGHIIFAPSREELSARLAAKCSAALP